MTQPSNIIRLDGFVGPPARQPNSERFDEVVSSVEAGRLPAESDGSDPGNVIPFARPRRDGLREDAAALVPGSTDRPAPAAAIGGPRAPIVALLLCSAVVHGGLLAVLNREPPPMASIGLEAISVEIVLGGPAETGTASTSNDGQSTTTERVIEPKAPEPSPNEQVAVKPQDPKTEPAQPGEAANEAPTTPREAAPSEPVVAAIPPPQALPTEPERAVVPTKPPEQPTAQPPKRPSAPERTPDRARGKPATDAPPNNKRAAVAPAAKPPGGAAPGRSDAETNYRGLAAAHLARFKQFPADARSRGDQGSSLVTFSIDGSGRVTKVALVRGTGVASLDLETQAMVRRASPFPPPPGGRSVTITAPVSFHLR
jgi:periplasmic protein TonB